jgi:hypothetical protein
MAKKPEVVSTTYHRLLDARAATLSGSSAIQYALLADPDHAQVFLLITAAEGGGNFNREVVAFDDLEAAVDAAPAGKPFGSKQLKGAYQGRSNNNAPYACAALIAQGLLAKAPDVKFGLVKAGDWDAWRLPACPRRAARTGDGNLCRAERQEEGQARRQPLHSGGGNDRGR